MLFVKDWLIKMYNDSVDDDSDLLSISCLPSLIRRAILWERLVRRHEEESIARLVPVDSQWLADKEARLYWR